MTVEPCCHICGLNRPPYVLRWHPSIGDVRLCRGCRYGRRPTERARRE